MYLWAYLSTSLRRIRSISLGPRSSGSLPLAAAQLLAIAGCQAGNVAAPGPGGQVATPLPTAPAPAPGPSNMPTPTGPMIPGATATVGLLVPLTGPNAGLGQALTQAAEMALFDSGNQTTALVVHDTEAPAGAPASPRQAKSTPARPRHR